MSNDQPRSVTCIGKTELLRKSLQMTHPSSTQCRTAHRRVPEDRLVVRRRKQQKPCSPLSLSIQDVSKTPMSFCRFGIRNSAQELLLRTVEFIFH